MSTTTTAEPTCAVRDYWFDGSGVLALRITSGTAQCWLCLRREEAQAALDDLEERAIRAYLAIPVKEGDLVPEFPDPAPRPYGDWTAFDWDYEAVCETHDPPPLQIRHGWLRVTFPHAVGLELAEVLRRRLPEFEE
jgi:hypothetical protein